VAEHEIEPEFVDESAAIDRQAAGQVHYTDPRVRALATAYWQLETGRGYREWLALGKEDPDALIQEGRDWMRAAVAAGLLAPPPPFVPFVPARPIRRQAGPIHLYAGPDYTQARCGGQTGTASMLRTDVTCPACRLLFNDETEA
jgi:hypothetical protein